MSLSTHIVMAVAVSVPFLKNPLASFFIGFVSHFLADAIPHWDWLPRSLNIGNGNAMNIGVKRDYRLIFWDVMGVFLDSLIGIVLVLIVKYPLTDFTLLWGMLAAAFGGILPDGLQFIYFLYKKEPLASLQKFHFWMHTKIRIPHEKVLKGILLQAPFVIVSLVIIRLFS